MRDSVERFGGADACLLVANADGFITHVSDSAVAMLGYDHRREVIGRLGAELWACPEDALKAREELWRITS
jgi:PAS domain-containing protein